MLGKPSPDGSKTFPFSDGSKHRIAERLGDEYGLSHATVGKYSMYAQALDRMAKHDPEIVPKILSGFIKLSHESVIKLSRLPGYKIRKLSQQLSNEEGDCISYSDARREMQRNFIMLGRTDKPIKLPEGSIKDMPAYDPDAAISSLSLTIPSWATSIERTRTTSDFSMVSKKARLNLTRQLIDLKKTIEELLAAIKEEK